ASRPRRAWPSSRWTRRSSRRPESVRGRDDGGCGERRGPRAFPPSAGCPAYRRAGENARGPGASQATTGTATPGHTGSRVLIGALVAGLAIRVGVAATVPTWFDEATMGLMAQDVLRGQFPFFFYGQTFMGAVDGYVQAVPFALLGDSLATLRLGAVVVVLG